MLFILERIQGADLYMVIPVHHGKPDPNNEYVFDNEEDQLLFCNYYRHNPIAAHYAYEAVQHHQSRKEAEEFELLFGNHSTAGSLEGLL